MEEKQSLSDEIDRQIDICNYNDNSRKISYIASGIILTGAAALGAINGSGGAEPELMYASFGALGFMLGASALEYSKRCINIESAHEELEVLEAERIRADSNYKAHLDTCTSPIR